MKFDVIVGNPPYQTPKEGQKGAYGTGTILWDKFIIKSLQYLKKNGYLCFVNPQLWRKPNHKILNLFKENNLIFLNMNNRKTTINYFGNVYISVDWYVLQKSEYVGKTEIIDYNNKKYIMDIQKYEFIPNKHLDFIYDRLYESELNKRLVLYMSTKFNLKNCKKNKNSAYKFPVMNVVRKSGIHNIFYSKYFDKFYNFPKIILSDMIRSNAAYNDFKGEYLISPHSFAIKIKNKSEGEKYKIIVASEKFKELMDSITWSNFQIAPNVFSYFKKDFWKYFVDENGNEME